MTDVSALDGDGRNRSYDSKVKAEIRRLMFEKWPPRDAGERIQLERNVRFFETECSFDEADADGRTIEEVADDEIDAAAL